MMRRIISLFAVAAAAIMVVFAFASCGGHNAADALIGKDGTTKFKIIRPDLTDDNTIDCAIGLRNKITDAIGFTFSVGTDFVKKGSDTYAEGKFEILVGATNRGESLAAKADTPRINDWSISRSGGKIVISGSDKLSDAIDYFVANYVGDGNVYIADGEKYVHSGDYSYDSILIAGAELKDFKIFFDSDLNATAAEEFCSKLAEDYGYRLTAEKFNASYDGKYVLFKTDKSLGNFTNAVQIENGQLIVKSGILADPSRSYGMLESCFVSSDSKILTLDASLNLQEDNMKENMVEADSKYLDGLQEKADKMKAVVLATKSAYTVGKNGTVYYFSENGDDGNDGLSEDKPLKTLEKLALLPLKAGDVVLFRRGELFRGNIKAVGGVTYSAYGEGDKPTISASKRNYADSSLWVKTDYKNVWVCTQTLTNVGIVALDHSGKLGEYDELVGDRMIAGRDGFTGAESMSSDMQVWSDLKNNKLYMYTETNPGERFKSIEIGERGNVFGIGGTDVTIDNLHITMTGSHGVGSGTTKNLTVRNCVFDWLGGSILTGFGGADVTGYGNAVEVYGGVDGYKVYNNWIYQIYDTGITHQYSKTPSTKTNKMLNVEYYDNLIEYCFWSIEYYNATGGEGTYRETSDVYVHDNFLRLGGYGWGCKGRAAGAPMYCLGSHPDKTENYRTENNIFDRCLGYLVSTYGEQMSGQYSFKGNTYVQPYSTKFAQLAGTVYNFDRTAGDILKSYFGEENPTLAFIMTDGN